jgi:hypothetical protein
MKSNRTNIAKKPDRVEIEAIINNGEELRLKVLPKALTEASASKSYRVLKKYEGAIRAMREKLKILDKYSEKTYMRIVKILLGPYELIKGEVYYSLVSERLKRKGIPLEAFDVYMRENLST